jgi:hypothetical protein
MMMPMLLLVCLFLIAGCVTDIAQSEPPCMINQNVQSLKKSHQQTFSQDLVPMNLMEKRGKNA